MQIITQIQSAMTQTLRNNVSLFDNLLPSSIQTAELPRAQDQLSVLPAVRIAPYGNISWERVGFEEPTTNYGYTIQVVIIAPGNLNITTDQDKYQRWQLNISKLLLPIAQYQLVYSNIWEVTISQLPLFDRSKVSDLYTYLGVLVTLQSLESSTQLVS